MNYLYHMILLFIIFLLPTNVRADTWKGACESDYPPYNFQKNRKNIGMDTEIVELVMKNIKNVTFTFETFPWARVLKNLENGHINFAWQFIDAPERRDKFILVGPIRNGKTVFIVPNNSNIKDWKKITDFNDKTIATVRGYKYSPELDIDTLSKRVDSNNNKDLIKKVARREVDVGIGDFNTLSYQANAMKISDQIRFLKTPLKILPRYVAFAKKDADKAKLFQTQLDIEKSTLEYKKIIQKYSN